MYNLSSKCSDCFTATLAIHLTSLSLTLPLSARQANVKSSRLCVLLPSCGLLSCHTFVLLQTPLFALAANNSNNNNSELTCRQDVCKCQCTHTNVNMRKYSKFNASTSKYTHSLTHTMKHVRNASNRAQFMTRATFQLDDVRYRRRYPLSL